MRATASFTATVCGIEELAELARNVLSFHEKREQLDYGVLPQLENSKSR
jgi:hypothetical protein